MTTLASRAASWRRQWALRAAAEAAARLGGAGLAALGGALWLDRLAAPSQPARWALWAAGLAGAAFAVYRWVARPFLSFGWSEVLNAAAREFPEVRESLKPAWELARRPADAGISEQLRAAHIARTNRAIEALPERPVFRLRLSAAARGCLVAGAAGLLALLPLRGGPSFERVLRPWRDVALERYVLVTPGDARLSPGQAVRIVARWAPASPVAALRQDLSLWTRGPQGWSAAPWDSSEENAAGYTVEELTGTLDYRLTWRDLTSRVYHLSAVAAPALDSLRVLIRGSQPQTLPLTAAAPISVLRGTWLTVAGTPNQPLSQAQLRLSSWPVPLPMKAQPSGDYEASFPLREDSSLTLDLEAQDGRKDPHPLVYQLKALADQPPQIELLSPTEPVRASPRDSVPISYSARDDGGLTSVSIVLQAPGRPSREIVFERPGGRRELVGDTLLDLSDEPLGRLEFQLKAIDNASPPQVGLSAKGVIDVSDLEGTHAAAEAQWLKAEASLKALAELERGAQALASNRRGPELAAAEQPLARSWKEAEEALRDLSARMGADVYANPGLAEAAKSAADEASRASSRELAAAQEAASRGDLPSAQQLHARLAKRAEDARRLLEEGRKVQGLQDVFSQAGRMGQTASGLASALQAPAATGRKVPPEQLKRLQSALGRLQKELQGLLSTLQRLPKADAAAQSRSAQSYQLPLEQALQSANDLARALESGDYAKAARLAEQLADQLAQAQKTLEQAAADAAAAPQSETDARLRQTRDLWSEVVEDQTRAMDQAQRLEDQRLAATLDAQSRLLAELEAEQSQWVSSASSMGAPFPQDALGAMRAVLAEFSARKIKRAAPLLEQISARLRSASEGGGLEAFARGEDEIRRKLVSGAQAKAPPEPSRQAARSQAGVREKTALLEGRLKGLDADLPDGTLESLSGAQGEQRSAEDSLGEGDSSRAVAHQRSALELLEQGSRRLSQMEGERQRLQAQIASPFGRPGVGNPSSSGAGGRSGAQMSVVPLPSAQDYRPAPEIRKELEKSLAEPRPPAYDGVIKEYFKRIAQ